jgi:excisionase family DNA binding protein
MPNTVDARPRFMKVRKAAEYLGIGRTSVKDLIAVGAFPGASKIGSHHLIPIEDLDGYAGPRFESLCAHQSRGASSLHYRRLLCLGSALAGPFVVLAELLRSASSPDTLPATQPVGRKLMVGVELRVPDHAAWIRGKCNGHLHKRAPCAPSHNCAVGTLSTWQAGGGTGRGSGSGGSGLVRRRRCGGLDRTSPLPLRRWQRLGRRRRLKRDEQRIGIEQRGRPRTAGAGLGRDRADGPGFWPVAGERDGDREFARQSYAQ